MNSSPQEYHFTDWKVKVNSPNTVAALKHLRERDKVDEIPITKEMHDYLENLCAYEML